MENFLVNTSTIQQIFSSVPFNIASYALLTMMVAQVCDFEVEFDFVHTFWWHTYIPIISSKRCCKLSENQRKLPTMKMNPDVKSIFWFQIWRLHSWKLWSSSRNPRRLSQYESDRDPLAAVGKNGVIGKRLLRASLGIPEDMKFFREAWASHCDHGKKNIGFTG